MRQSLLLSQGDPSIFVSRPISGIILAIAAVLFLLPVIKWIRQRGGATGREA